MERPVINATVCGTFTGRLNSTVCGRTTTFGYATITGVTPYRQGYETFTITSITHPSYTYDPTWNMVPSLVKTVSWVW